MHATSHKCRISKRAAGREPQPCAPMAASITTTPPSPLNNTDIQTILSSFSFPGTPYHRVPTQKSPGRNKGLYCINLKIPTTATFHNSSDETKSFIVHVYI